MAFGGLLAVSVVGVTLAGRDCDRRVPTRALWSGLIGFLGGLLMAGIAPSMMVLIAARVLQGLGTGAISVALYVVVARAYPPVLRARMFSALSAGWVIPSLFGPALAGWIVQHTSWRWIFLSMPLLVAPAAAVLRRPLTRLRAVPVDDVPAPAHAGWAVGVALGVLTLYVAGQSRGSAALLTMAIATAVVTSCVRRLVPPGTLAAGRGLPSVILLRGLAAAAFFGCEAFVPLLLSRERGLTPTLTGVALSAGALSWFCGAWYQGLRVQIMPRHRLIAAGATLLALGIGVTASAIHPAMSVAAAVAGWILAGSGMGLISPSLSVMVLQLSPPGSEGRNSSAMQLTEAVTVATVLAVSGSLFARLLDHQPTLGYALAFAPAFALALLAGILAHRTRP